MSISIQTQQASSQNVSSAGLQGGAGSSAHANAQIPNLGSVMKPGDLSNGLLKSANPCGQATCACPPKTGAAKAGSTGTAKAG